MSKTGQSPLANKETLAMFTGVYIGLWVLQNFLRPARFALSVVIAPFFNKLVELIKRTFKLKRTALAFAGAHKHAHEPNCDYVARTSTVATVISPLSGLILCKRRCTQCLVSRLSRGVGDLKASEIIARRASLLVMDFGHVQVCARKKKQEFVNDELL